MRFHLQARTALRTPGEERTLERFRTPSVVYGPDALITHRPFISWRPVRDATKRLRTVLPSLVPPRAFNARATSLGLEPHDFARGPRCVRPTSAIHCLPNSVPALLVSDPLCSTPEGVVRSEDPSFHDALDPLRQVVRRRGGVFALALGRSCLLGIRSQNALAPLTTLPLTPRHPPSHASAFAGRFAWCPLDRDRFPRPS